MPYGVTPEMLDAYGDAIFELSLNKQVRRGDPVRTLDPEAWGAERDATGLSDHEIAARVGLAIPQVTYIRNVVERRIFRIDQYRKLFRLGGGKRYREEDYRDPEEAYAVRPDALALRAAVAFDAKAVTAWIDAGHWGAETLTDRLAVHAEAAPDRAAVVGKAGILGYGALNDRSRAVAAGLIERDVGRGDVVALLTDRPEAFAAAYLGIAAMGGVALVLDPNLGPKTRAARLHHVRARAAIVDGSRLGGTGGARALKEQVASLKVVIAVGRAPPGIERLDAVLERPAPNAPVVPPVAADPVVIVDAGGRSPPRLVPFTHQNVLANAAALAARLGIEVADTIAPAGPFCDHRGLLALHLALAAGAGVATQGAGAPTVLFEPPDAKRAPKPERDRSAPRLVVTPIGALRQAPGGTLIALAWILPETQAIAASAPVRADTKPARPGVHCLDGVEIREQADATLALRGPGVAAGYIDHPAANRRGFARKGWFCPDIAGSVGADGAIAIRPNRKSGRATPAKERAGKR